MKFFPHKLLFALLSLTLLTGCGVGKRTLSNRNVSLKQFTGTELVILVDKHPWVDLVKPRLQEFTSLTGIDILLEEYPEEQFRIKRLVEMLSGISEVDLFMIMPGNSLDSYIKEGWVVGLSSYLKDPLYSWPDYDLGDVFDTAIQAGIRGGESYTLPIMLETSLLAYNKKILDEMGLTVPGTMEELEATARAVYEGSNHRIYGITMRGKRRASTSQWIDFVHSFGGDWLDDEGQAALHTKAVLDASSYYGRLLRYYGPPNAPSNGWYESTSLFMQEKAAMVYDANVFNNNYENPQISKVAGNVGYAVIPAGPAGAAPHVSSWGLSLYKGSENKGAALYFMQWATGKENALMGLQKGIPAARKSAWESLAAEGGGLSHEWVDASLASYEIAGTNWNPPVTDIDKGRDIVSDIITAAILQGSLNLTALHSSQLLNELIAEESGMHE